MAYQGSITLVDLSDGQSGSSGINTATIYLYKRAATVPNKPNGTLRYTFSTHTLSGDYFNEWESSIDNLSGNNPIWIIAATATASVDIDYDDILYTEWSNPIKMAENGQDGQPGQPGQPGQDGTPGINTATVYIYQRASSTPSTPANTSYTFATGSFIVPTNWYKEIPTTNGNPCYIASAVAISTEATASLEWSTPVILVEDGTDGQPGLPGEPGAQGASVATERELYYLKTNSTLVPQITEISQITSTDRQNGWTSISPTYVSGGSYYTCIETTLNNDGVTELIWSEPVLNQGLTVANANASLAISQADAVNTQLGGHFIYKGVQVSQTPAGAGVIQLTKNQQDQDVTGDPNQWGYNTWIGSNGIKLRLNQIDLSFWSNTGLTFYNPSMNSPNNKGIELNINGLSLYKPLAPGEQNQLTAAQLTANGLNFYGTSVSTPDVTLNADGLTLINGSIRGGIVGQDEFLYLSPQVFADEYEEYILSEDTEVDETKAYYIRSGEEGEYIYTEVSEPTGNPQENGYYEIAHAPGTIPIDNYVKSNWRQIIGRKFAVDTDGNLYANNANIEGAITATSLTIGSGSDAYDGAAAINISGYDIEIEKNGIDEVEGVSVYLYPILYHNGVQVPTIEVDYSHFIWYQDDDTIGTEGDGNNSGRYLATYGHNYRVIYDFDDGAVGGGTEVVDRTIDPSKYITKISDTGITIHPEVWTNQSSYIQLDGTGMELFNSSGNSIAQYGSTARIGLNNSSRFLMNNNSLEAYDNNNNKYFEVNSSGLSWGNNTAATTDDVEDAAKTATNYITYINSDNGIRIYDGQDINEDLNYAQINSTGMQIYRNNEEVASFGHFVRVGADTDNSAKIFINPSNNANGLTNMLEMQTRDGVSAFLQQTDDNRYVNTGTNLGFAETVYAMGSQSVSTTPSTKTASFTVAPLRQLSNNTDFTLTFITQLYAQWNDIVYSTRPSPYVYNVIFNFTKGISKTFNITQVEGEGKDPRDNAEVLMGITHTYDVTYDGNYTITLTSTAQQFRDSAPSGNSHYDTVQERYEIENTFLARLKYDADNKLMPVLRLCGDIILGQDGIGSTFIELDIDSDASATTDATYGKDKNLFNVIRSLNWYNPVISGIILNQHYATVTTTSDIVVLEATTTPPGLEVTWQIAPEDEQLQINEGIVTVRSNFGGFTNYTVTASTIFMGEVLSDSCIIRTEIPG